MPKPIASNLSETRSELSVLMREFVRHFLFGQRQFAASQGQSASMRMLLVLSRYEPMTQTELGQLLGLEKSWVSRSIQQLVELGWVERQALEHDKRCFLLHVTAAGLLQAQELERSFNGHAQQLLAKVPSDQHEQLAQTFQTLVQALRDNEQTSAEDQS